MTSTVSVIPTMPNDKLQGKRPGVHPKWMQHPQDSQCPQQGMHPHCGSTPNLQKRIHDDDDGDVLSKVRMRSDRASEPQVLPVPERDLVPPTHARDFKPEKHLEQGEKAEVRCSDGRHRHDSYPSGTDQIFVDSYLSTFCACGGRSSQY